MSTLNLSLARKVMQVANGGEQLAQLENFEMQIIRDGVAWSIGKDKEGNSINKFFQKNLHFKKMRNFTDQVNSLTNGFSNCEIIAGTYKVKFKGGKFAINAEKLLKEITENYFRTTHQIAIVDNESVEFEATQDKFVESFVGEQTSILNYLALIDTFKNASSQDLFALSAHMGFSEDGSQLVFSDLITGAQPNILQIIKDSADPRKAYMEALENKDLSKSDKELLAKTTEFLIENNKETTAE